MNIPALQGNWVDFLIIGFTIFYIWEGWGKGFITQVLEVISFVGAFLLALKFYPFAAKLLVDNFTFSRALGNAVGFLILGILLEQIIAKLMEEVHLRIPKKWHQHKFNSWLSIVPLTFNAILILTFILILTLTLPVKGVIKHQVVNSKIGGPIIAKTQKIEKRLSGIFGEAISVTINFVTTGPIESREQVDLNFTQKELSVDEASETEMLTRVNKERRDKGLKEFVSNEKLRDLSRIYARDMFERGYFSHYNPEGESPFDRMKKSGITYETAGENLALAPNITIAHQGLMDSPGHRENILNPEFGKIGIGVVDGGIYGKMFVQEFTN